MIATATADPRLAAAGDALAARFGGGAVVPALPAAAAEWARWAESLTTALAAPAAFAVLEHLFGVMPLLAACFTPAAALEAALEGRRLGALGLFTPAPELSWDAAAVAAEPDGGGGLRLHGLVRIPFAGADGVLLPARLPGGELRLAWLGDGAAVERRGERGGGPVQAGAPCWIAVDGAAAGPEAVSRPVDLGPNGDAGRILASCARVCGLAAAITAGAAVTALRRAARTTAHGGRPWSASQVVAMDLAELEIEAELAAIALRAEPAAGAFAAAAAAARLLAAAAAKTAELRGLGLAPAGPLAGGCAVASLTAFLGGAQRLESAAADALGLREHEPAAEGGV